MQEPSVSVRLAQIEDLAPILAIQYEAFGRVAVDLGIDPESLPPLLESHADLRALYAQGTAFFVACTGSEVIGSVRARETEGVVEFGRLVVAAEHLRKGVATELMRFAESAYPAASRFELFTGEDAYGALALYRGLGYEVVRGENYGGVQLVWLEKKKTGV